MTARCLMVLGTSSSAGKSLLVAALCRSFARRGWRVAPFKAQNMSNNAAVCPDGGEIGRAQALQAIAAGIPFNTDLNPILIKPMADAYSQVIIDGRPFKSLGAVDYYTYKQELWAHVTAALDRLRAANDLVIMEGAGSPVELNLKAGDLVNLAPAIYADAPILLVGDIDRGGIFAQLLGTLWLLEPEERARVRGLVVNKFRGDLRLFEDGVRILEEKGGVPVLGVIPYLRDLDLPEEDAVALDRPDFTASDAAAAIDIAVIHLPLISNFDDFDPLRAEPGVRVRYVSSPAELGQPDAIILPGTKSSMADLEWLHQRGLAPAIRHHAEQGKVLVGVCGGYQMLGRAIHDPQRVEAQQETLPGLGLLGIETTFEAEKATYQVKANCRGGPGWLADLATIPLEGYEIHMGRTDSSTPWLEITIRNGAACQVADGAASPDGKIWGCYLHGLFANTALRHAWLESLGWREHTSPSRPIASKEQQEGNTVSLALSRLADAIEAALDMKKLEEILWAE
jgi:adenosylcobyric acid synthase